ncbi:MAG: glycoside hydrolase family 99-like domain-containing protein, partial [Bacteroidales bacterium]|nr:glycoside hydrolase family 99-like domain-containing protein [Bacteroidales bacterium]
MRRLLTLLSVFGAVVCLVSCSQGKKNVTVNPGDDIYVCAYVWPSCHDDPLAHKWLWEEGIGEWEVIKKGDKRFPEHYQPRQPLWGYEMDNDPEVVEKWIQTA